MSRVKRWLRRIGIALAVFGVALTTASLAVATAEPRKVAGIVLLAGGALPGGHAGAWLSHLLLPPWYTSAYRIATDWDWLFRKGLRSAWGPGRPPFTRAFVEAWER